MCNVLVSLQHFLYRVVMYGNERVVGKEVKAKDENGWKWVGNQPNIIWR